MKLAGSPARGILLLMILLKGPTGATWKSAEDRGIKHEPLPAPSLSFLLLKGGRKYQPTNLSQGSIDVGGSFAETLCVCNGGGDGVHGGLRHRWRKRSRTASSVNSDFEIGNRLKRDAAWYQGRTTAAAATKTNADGMRCSGIGSAAMSAVGVRQARQQLTCPALIFLQVCLPDQLLLLVPLSIALKSRHQVVCRIPSCFRHSVQPLSSAILNEAA